MTDDDELARRAYDKHKGSAEWLSTVNSRQEFVCAWLFGYRARAAEPCPSIVRQTSTVAYLRDGTRVTIERGNGPNGPRLSISMPEVKALAATETLACFLCDRKDEHTHAPESARAAEPAQFDEAEIRWQRVATAKAVFASIRSAMSLGETAESAVRISESTFGVEPPQPRRFPVTDDLLDAPDGAIVDGYQRNGDEWVRLPEPPQPASVACVRCTVCALVIPASDYHLYEEWQHEDCGGLVVPWKLVKPDEPPHPTNEDMSPPALARIFHELRAHRRRTWNRPADDEFEYWMRELERRLAVKR